MSENFSDLFNDSEQQFCSDADPQRSSSDQIIKLKEQIETLQKENQSLQAQFEGSLAITNQIEAINNELLQTKTQNRKLVAENEDLKHRLDLAIKAKKELADQIAEEKKNNAQTRSENYLNTRQEIDRQKAAFQQKLDDANKQLVELTAQLDARDVTKKIVDGKIDRIVQNAQRFFNQEFSSFDNLAAFLAQPPAPVQKPQTPSAVAIPIQAKQRRNSMPDDSRINELASKLKSTKAKVRDLTETNQKLQAQLAQLVAENQNLAQESKKVVASYEAKLDDQDRQIKEKSAKISSLEVQVNNLVSHPEKKTVKVAKEPEVSVPQVKPQVVVQKVVDEDKIKEIKDEAAHDKQKFIEESTALKSQLNNAQIKNNELSQKLSALQAEFDKLKSENSKQKNEIDTMTVLKDNALKEAESLRTALHARMPKPVEPKKEKPLITKEELKKLRETVESQKKEILALNIQVNKGEDTIQQQRSDIADAKAKSATLEENIKQLTMDLNEAKCQLARKPVPTVEDVLPADLWRTNDFGTKVAEEINAIARNTSLQPVSKLRSIYSTIREDVNSKFNKLTEVNEELADQLADIQTAVGEFLIDISVSLFDKAFTFDEFMKVGGNAIVSEIQMLRSENDNMKHKYDALQTTLDSVTSVLQLPESANVNQILDTFDIITRQLQERTEMLAETKKKFKLLKISYQEASEKSQQHEEQILAEHNEMAEALQKAESDNKALADDLTKAKTELDAKDSQLQTALGQIKELQDDIQAAVDKVINEAKAEVEQKNVDLQQSVDKAQKTIADQEKKNTDNDKKIKDLEAALNQLTTEKLELNAALNTIKAESEEREAELMKKCEEEKAAIKAQFDSAVQQLSAQCAKQLEDITKMAADNSTNEQKMIAIRAAAKKILCEKRKAESDAKFAQEQFERNRRLVEAQARAKIVNAENLFNSKLEEERAAHESDQRRIFTFVAEAFKNFFNPSANFSERNFRQMIEQVKDELTRLNTSDENIRRMLGAGEKQTTEDAVAMLLLH